MFMDERMDREIIKLDDFCSTLIDQNREKESDAVIRFLLWILFDYVELSSHLMFDHRRSSNTFSPIIRTLL